jgi:hypothetical protein
VSVWCPPCAFGIAAILKRKMQNTHAYQMELVPALTTLIIGTPIPSLPSFIAVSSKVQPQQHFLTFWQNLKDVIAR